MPEPTSYYIRRPGGAAQGPFPADKIRGYIQQGRVTAAMEFSADGHAWHAGAQVPALFPSAAPPLPSPPPRRPPAPPRKRPPRRTKGGPEDHATRQAVNRAIATAHRNLRAMRGLFIADAVLVALAFLVALGTDSGTFKLIVGGLLATIVLCTIYVVRFPLPSALVLAVFHTAIALPVLLAGIQTLSGVIYVLLAFVAWGTVLMASNLQKLLKQYPDALAARRVRGERLAAGEASTKWRDRDRADRAGQRKKLALYVGLPLALGVAALIVFGGSDDRGPGGAAYKPPPKPAEPLQPKLDAFRAAWNGKALDEVTAFFASDLRDRKARLLGKLFRRREWTEKRPAITFEQRDSVVAHQVAIFWTIADYDRVMQTDWQWEKGGWWLLDLKLRIRR